MGAWALESTRGRGCTTEGTGRGDDDLWARQEQRHGTNSGRVGRFFHFCFWDTNTAVNTLCYIKPSILLMQQTYAFPKRHHRNTEKGSPPREAKAPKYPPHFLLRVWLAALHTWRDMGGQVGIEKEKETKVPDENFNAFLAFVSYCLLYVHF